METSVVFELTAPGYSCTTDRTRLQLSRPPCIDPIISVYDYELPHMWQCTIGIRLQHLRRPCKSI